MHQQLWGYKVELKSVSRGTGGKMLNTTGVSNKICRPNAMLWKHNFDGKASIQMDFNHLFQESLGPQSSCCGDEERSLYSSLCYIWCINEMS